MDYKRVMLTVRSLEVFHSMLIHSTSMFLSLPFCMYVKSEKIIAEDSKMSVKYSSVRVDR